MTAVEPIFLLSLPRSGSTLLQRLLGAHPQIHTLGEPWLLLPHLCALAESHVYTHYGHRLAAAAIERFCEHLPGGIHTYREALHDFVVRVYADASPAGTRYFLDKTPRYSLIADELARTFPEAPLVFLWRNPLAVVASMVDTWLGGRWMPYHHKVDLFDGLAALTEVSQRLGQRALNVRYERLVQSPEEELARILNHLSLPDHPGMLKQFTGVTLGDPMWDRRRVERYGEVSMDSLERWRAAFASPVRRSWCRRYLQWIGADRLQFMGYNFAELEAALLEDHTSLRTLAPDVMMTLKGVLWSVVEPQIARDKIATVPRWGGVYSHR